VPHPATISQHINTCPHLALLSCRPSVCSHARWVHSWDCYCLRPALTCGAPGLALQVWGHTVQVSATAHQPVCSQVPSRVHTQQHPRTLMHAMRILRPCLCLCTWPHATYEVMCMLLPAQERVWPEGCHGASKCSACCGVNHHDQKVQRAGPPSITHTVSVTRS
jgi:hypothetical protein